MVFQNWQGLFERWSKCTLPNGGYVCVCLFECVCRYMFRCVSVLRSAVLSGVLCLFMLFGQCDMVRVCSVWCRACGMLCVCMSV